MLTLIVPARLTAQVSHRLTRQTDGWFRLEVTIGTTVSRFFVSPGGFIKRG